MATDSNKDNRFVYNGDSNISFDAVVSADGTSFDNTSIRDIGNFTFEYKGISSTSTGVITSGTITSGSWSPSTFDPQAGQQLAQNLCPGHVVEGRFCEIREDGLIEGACSLCDAPVLLKRIPGGHDYLLVKDLMRYLMSGGDPDDVAGEILMLRKALNAQQAALDDGLDLLKIAERMLRRGVSA